MAAGQGIRKRMAQGPQDAETTVALDQNIPFEFQRGTDEAMLPGDGADVLVGDQNRIFLPRPPFRVCPIDAVGIVILFASNFAPEAEKNRL